MPSSHNTDCRRGRMTIACFLRQGKQLPECRTLADTWAIGLGSDDAARSHTGVPQRDSWARTLRGGSDKGRIGCLAVHARLRPGSRSQEIASLPADWRDVLLLDVTVQWTATERQRRGDPEIVSPLSHAVVEWGVFDGHRVVGFAE